MYEALDTQDYRYVVTLRHSRERYLSHFRHMDRETPRYKDRLLDVVDGAAGQLECPQDLWDAVQQRAQIPTFRRAL